MINLFKILKVLSFIFIIYISIFALNSSASSVLTEIYLSKEINIVNKGDTFLVSLNISSPEKEINVVDGTIIYDKSILEIEKISFDKSIFSIWSKEPTFNNEKGELSFIGGRTEGFKDKGGLILGIVFYAKKSGETTVSYKDMFSVFLNDGLGTRVNPWLKPLSLNISEIKTTNNIYINMVLYKYYILLSISVILLIIFTYIRYVRKNK